MGTLVTYTVQEIEAQGGQFQALSLQFQNKIFKRGLRCPKGRSKGIQAYAKICQRNRENVVVIEDNTYITFWKQTTVSGNQPQVSPAISQFQSAEVTDLHPIQEKTGPDKNASLCLSSDIIDCCRKAMLITVGPIANLILKEELAKSKNMAPIELIDSLGTRLPNEDLRDRFLQELQHF